MAPVPDPLVRRQRLPGVLGRIEDLIGYDLAEAFAVRFGGQQLYIPRDPGPDHPIARVIGHRAAQLIGAELGAIGSRGDGGSWMLPVGEVELKWNIARRLTLAGKSRNEIVRILRTRYGIAASCRRISEAIRDLPRDRRLAQGRAPHRPRPAPAPPPIPDPDECMNER